MEEALHDTLLCCEFALLHAAIDRLPDKGLYEDPAKQLAWVARGVDVEN